MYRCIKSSQILSVIEDFDLEDFGEYVLSNLKRKLETDNIYVDHISIDNNLDGEFLNIDIIVDGTKYSVSQLLDSRRIKRPRDLISKYSDPVITDFVDQLDADDILGASYFMEQEFTSKQTASGNGSYNHGAGRVPTLFKKISWTPGTVNFDYGCGYASTHARVNEFLEERGVTNIGFDKYHQTDQEKSQAWNDIEALGGADTVTCANVLNVVKERDIRINEILSNIYEVLKPGGVAYFDAYESDRSGVGSQTGKDNYQLKRSIDGYVEEVAEVFGENNVKLKGKLIIARK